MRRPAPLPAPPPPARPRSDDDVPEVRVVLPVRPAPDSAEPHGAPPVTDDPRTGGPPLDDQDAGEPRADDPRAGEPNPGETDTTDEEPAFGVRDVWRAARARRRALRAEVRRFTTRQRRRRMLWLGAAAAVVLLVAGTVGAAYSPLFAVRTITVTGTAQLDAAAVEAALDDQVGAPLALVDTSAVKAALVQFPLVETYSLEARPPNDLLVRIVERTPIGVREGPAGFTVLDAAGVVLSTTPDAPAGLPTLDVSGSTALRAAGQVMRSLPDDIRAQVTAVTASTADNVTLTLGGTNTTIVWGSAERSADKAFNLSRIMVNRPPDQVNSYDVSSPEAIVVG